MAPQAEDPEHFYELVRYYLDHLDEAEEIGRACSFLISSRHSYRHRAAEYDEWFYRRGRYDHGEGKNRQWAAEVEEVRRLKARALGRNERARRLTPTGPLHFEELV